VLILELARFEVAGLGVDDVPGQFQHVAGDFLVRDVVEVAFLFSDLVRVSQDKPMSPLPRASSAIMCSRDVKTTLPIATIPFLLIASRMTANA
jgi:hypothetical protein